MGGYDYTGKERQARWREQHKKRLRELEAAATDGKLGARFREQAAAAITENEKLKEALREATTYIEELLAREAKRTLPNRIFSLLGKIIDGADAEVLIAARQLKKHFAEHDLTWDDLINRK